MGVFLSEDQGATTRGRDCRTGLGGCPGLRDRALASGRPRPHHTAGGSPPLSPENPAMRAPRSLPALLLAALALPLLGHPAAAQEAGTKRPNIVFIFSDDHAYQAIGAYGSKVNQT